MEVGVDSGERSDWRKTLGYTRPTGAMRFSSKNELFRMGPSDVSLVVLDYAKPMVLGPEW